MEKIKRFAKKARDYVVENPEEVILFSFSAACIVAGVMMVRSTVRDLSKFDGIRYVLIMNPNTVERFKKDPTDICFSFDEFPGHYKLNLVETCEHVIPENV